MSFFFAMAQWEYKHIRLDYKGRRITQEINLLDIDGERIRGWGGEQEVPTLPEMFEALGKDGWEMVVIAAELARKNSPLSINGPAHFADQYQDNCNKTYIFCVNYHFYP